MNPIKYFKYIFIIIFFFILPNVSEAADRYWTGGCSTTNWNCNDAGPNEASRGSVPANDTIRGGFKFR